MAENNVVNLSVVQLSAADLDLGDNAHFDYVIGDVIAYCADAAAGCDDVTTEWFHVDPLGGALSITRTLDRETHSQFRVTVLAVDHGHISQTGSTIVDITVDDVNDQQPTFLNSKTGNNNGGGLEMAVAEDATSGALVGRLTAIDRDATAPNNLIYYSFRSAAGAKFAVVAETGEVRVNGSLDREVESIYSLTAVVSDARRLSAVQTLTITILDVNDHSPTFIFPSSLNDTVTMSALLAPGGLVTRVLALDQDDGRNARLTYRLLHSSHNFNLHPQDGGVYLNFRLDVRLPHAEYRLTVVAEDHGIVSRSSTAQLIIRVNRSFPFPLPAGSRDPDVVQYNVAIVAVGVLTSAALVGVVMLVLVVFARRRRHAVVGSNSKPTRTGSPLSAVSTNYLQTLPLADITPRSSTVRVKLTFHGGSSFLVASSRKSGVSARISRGYYDIEEIASVKFCLYHLSYLISSHLTSFHLNSLRSEATQFAVAATDQNETASHSSL